MIKILGEGDYSVAVADRGGVTLMGEVTGISNLQFERLMDDTSTCTIVVTEPDSRCCEMLGNLRTARHEVIVHRNGHRVWEGPITRLAYKPGQIEIDARDISWFLTRRVLDIKIDHAGTSFPALSMLRDTLLAHYPWQGDPYNIGQFITVITGSDDPNTAAVYKSHTRTLGNLLEQYASRGGVDYTVTGRRLIILDTHTRAHVLPKMTDEHLSGSVNLTEYGMELKTRTFVSNSEDSYSQALAPQEWLDYYGPIDFVDNNSDEGDGEPETDEEKEAVQEIATRILLTGYPTPVRLWIPDDSRLDPCYPVEFSDLHAGAWVPIQSSDTCRKFTQWQKLRSLSVTWTPGSDSVNVTLTKAPEKHVEPSNVIVGVPPSRPPGSGDT